MSSERDAKPNRTMIANTDPDVQHGPVGTGPGYSGHEYDADDHAIDKALDAGIAPTASKPESDPSIPADNGRRAFFDKKTGEVHGSGVGAGGGAEGEDFASDAAAGDGFPDTGGTGTP